MKHIYSLPAVLRFLFLWTISVAVSCGSSIKNAQDFLPNNPPVISGYTLTDNSTGGTIDSANVVLGLNVKCSVQAYDPEKKPLTFSFDSECVSRSSQTNTSDGCEGVFIVTKVVENTPVTMTVTVRDEKGAVAAQLIPVGNGKAGPQLSIGSPVKSSINSADRTTFTFSCGSSGQYLVMESSEDLSLNPKSAMKSSTAYSSGDQITVNVAGPSYSVSSGESVVKVSSGDGAKKIWVIFKDENNYYTASYITVTLDSANPSVISITPATGATGVSTNPEISVVFSENMDSATLSSALTLSGGATVTLTGYDSSTYTARYSTSALTGSTTYTAKVSGAKDPAGNAAPDVSVTFTVNRSITFDSNNAGFQLTGGAMSPQIIHEGTTVTLATNKFTMGGFDFLGWSTSPTGTVEYADGASYTMGSSSVTLYAVWTWKTYSIGGTGPAGGIIFYINAKASTPSVTVDATFIANGSGNPSPAIANTGWKYLEVVPVGYEKNDLKWAPNTSTNVTDTFSAIGSGYSNTNKIKAIDSSTSSCAAAYCGSLTVGSCTDWFLPSYVEVGTLISSGKGGLTPNVCYMSSSQVNNQFSPSYPNFHLFSFGVYFITPSSISQEYILRTSDKSFDKALPLYTRAIRRF
jgi:hypothetical protein